MLNSRITSRICIGILAAFTVGAITGHAGPRKKIYLDATLDVSPLAEKVDELNQLLQASVVILRQQVENVEKPIKDNGVAISDLTERIEKIEEGLKKIVDVLVKKPVAFEYKMLRTASERQANELGATGWELVTSIRNEWMVFRKPIYDVAGAMVELEKATEGVREEKEMKEEEKKAKPGRGYKKKKSE